MIVKIHLNKLKFYVNQLKENLERNLSHQVPILEK